MQDCSRQPERHLPESPRSPLLPLGAEYREELAPESMQILDGAPGRIFNTWPQELTKGVSDRKGFAQKAQHWCLNDV